MDEGTLEKTGYVGALAVALATLRFVFSRSRVATVDEKYSRLRSEVKQQLEELERKMNDQFREVRIDMAQNQGRVQRIEDDAHEQKMKVMRTLDEMQTSFQLGIRSMKAALGVNELPPSRQV